MEVRIDRNVREEQVLQLDVPDNCSKEDLVRLVFDNIEADGWVVYEHLYTIEMDKHYEHVNAEDLV